MPLSCVGYLLLGMWSCLKNGLCMQQVSVGENSFFICKWLSIKENVWFRNGDLGLFLSVLGLYLRINYAGSLQAPMDSEFISVSPAVLEDLVSLVPCCPLYPLTLKLSTFSCVELPGP